MRKHTGKKENTDTSVLEYNLSLSYEQRLEQHQKALDLFLALQNSRGSTNEGLKQSTRTTSKK
jgi:hypothetical protein